MYSLNKLVGLLTGPMTVATLALLLAVFLALLQRGRWARWIALFAALWLWFWSSPATARWLGIGLEREFPVMRVEDAPQADMIVVLGGGVGGNTNYYPYGEMWTSADRVWHGARLYKAGKAPKIHVTGKEIGAVQAQLLNDFGVPKDAVVWEEARNTEEEAKAIARMFECSECSKAEKTPKVLLVTSAWHMRRAKLMFEKYAKGVEVVPAATDYEALVMYGWKMDFGWGDLLPSSTALFANSYLIKEIVGYWGYRWFR